MIFPLTTHPLQVHALFEAAALSGGAFYYRHLVKRSGARSERLLEGGNFVVLLGCLLGAALGKNLVFWAEMPQFALYWSKPEAWFSGQSVVGGLLGGLLGVELAKKLAGVRRSTGDAFVFPVLLGLIIGRLGCFAAGLADGTFGIPTHMPWAVDFGDGIPRHPTQLYEIGFAAILWWLLSRIQFAVASEAGLLFKLMLSAYLIWRLFIDGLKPTPFDYGFGLSGIQVVCAAALLIYIPLTYQQWQSLRARA